MRCGVHDVVSIACQLLHQISARFQPVDGEGTPRASFIGADHRAAAAAGPGHILDLKKGPLNWFLCHGIVLPYDQRTEGCILEADSFALISVDNDRLCDGFFELESVRRLHLGDGELAGVQPLAQLMDFDLASGVRKRLTVVNRGGGLRSFTVAGIGDVEFGVLDRLPRNRIFLENGQFRGLSVAEHESLFIICA